MTILLNYGFILFVNQPEKIYVMPNYKYNCYVQGLNVYHVKNTISDLRVEDFAIAAQEYQQAKHVANLNKNLI